MLSTRLRINLLYVFIPKWDRHLTRQNSVVLAWDRHFTLSVLFYPYMWSAVTRTVSSRHMGSTLHSRKLFHPNMWSTLQRRRLLHSDTWDIHVPFTREKCLIPAHDRPFAWQGWTLHLRVRFQADMVSRHFITKISGCCITTEEWYFIKEKCFMWTWDGCFIII